jgi:hypothetical protein
MRAEVIGEKEQAHEEHQVECDDKECLDVILRCRHGEQSELKELLRRQL